MQTSDVVGLFLLPNTRNPDRDTIDHTTSSLKPSPRSKHQRFSGRQTRSIINMKKLQSFQDDTVQWGLFKPKNPTLPPIYVTAHKSSYSVGTSSENDIVLRGPQIESVHSIIYWDRLNGPCVEDMSIKGTYVNGASITPNQRIILRNGAEVSFGGDINSCYVFYFRTERMEGTPVSHFDLEYSRKGLIDEGGHSSVIEAVSKQDGTSFAVKVIKNVVPYLPGYHDPRKQKRGISEELFILSRCEHRGICTFVDWFFDRNINTLYLVQEHMRGGTLGDNITNYGRLTESHAQHITYQICDALRYLHKYGVVHRDLKVDNVLVDDAKVKLIDFGQSKILNKSWETRGFCGTPGYRAPEVCLESGDGPYSTTVDSWSLGVIVFVMLTTFLPFPEIADDATYIRQILHTKDAYRDVLKKVNASYDAMHFIDCLLQYEPERRLLPSALCCHGWLGEPLRAHGFEHFHAESVAMLSRH